MAKQKITSRADAGNLTGAEVIPVVRVGALDPNLKTTAGAIADLAANMSADTIFTANGTIADPTRIVEIPANGTLYFGKRVPDDTIETVYQNCFFISDDGGIYLALVLDGNQVFTANSDGSIGAKSLNVDNSIIALGSISGKRGISAQTSNFTSAGDSGTRYTDEGSGTGVQTTPFSAVRVGTVYHYSVVDDGIRIYTELGETITFWNGASTQTIDSDLNGSFFDLTEPGMFATVEKLSDGKWHVTSNNGGIYND